MKYSYLLILLMLNSCIQNTKEDNIILKVKNTTTENKQSKEFIDTILIDYYKHETLLNVLKKLPETKMNNWEWSRAEKVKTVTSIKGNNYIINSIEMSHNIKYIKPNAICVQVLDDYWILSIYEFNKNHYFIVTNNILGDANDIQTFSFINNEIIPLKMINWFDGAGYKLLKNNSKECTQLIEDNLLSFGYDFSAENDIEISSLLTKSESQGCLEGNTIKYRLNKQKRTFDIIDVYWK